MDQVNAMQQYITKLKTALTELQQKNKDLEVKLDYEHKLVQSLEEKLEYTEKKLSNEKEQVEILGIKVDEYEKQLKSRSDTKKPSFLGKVFNNSQLDQLTIKVNQTEQSLDLQIQENEKLHAQVFTLKTQLELQENKLDEEQKTAQQKFQKLKLYYTLYQYMSILILINNFKQQTVSIRESKKRKFREINIIIKSSSNWIRL